MSGAQTPCNLVLIMLCDLILPCGDENELQTAPSFPVRVFKSEGVNENPDVADESVEVIGNAMKESSSSSNMESLLQNQNNDFQEKEAY